jgi:hypothetical protein
MRPPKSVQHLIGSNLHFNTGCKGLTELAAMSALGQKRTKKAAMRRPFSLNRLH